MSQLLRLCSMHCIALKAVNGISTRSTTTCGYVLYINHTGRGDETYTKTSKIFFQFYVWQQPVNYIQVYNIFNYVRIQYYCSNDTKCQIKLIWIWVNAHFSFLWCFFHLFGNFLLQVCSVWMQIRMQYGIATRLLMIACMKKQKTDDTRNCKRIHSALTE